jgi:hypothetical protein
MQSEWLLFFTAIAVAFLHTLTGPDHYLPFIALAKARRWSLARTMMWTLICGFGHVGSSVVLGLGGAALGWSMSSIKWLESVRGGIAGWCLLGFGLVYAAWGFVRAKQNRAHKHFDIAGDGSVYVFQHRHGEMVAPRDRYTVTPWVIFIIFVLGPCEPMIPLLYFPAAKASWWIMTELVIIYMAFTLLTMSLMVVLGYFGIAYLKTTTLERYMHALGGVTIFLCGGGMVFLNW